MPDTNPESFSEDRAERRAVAHEEKRRRSREDFPPNMRREEASQYFKEILGLSIAKNTLAKQAVQGGGAKFRKLGRFPMYTPDDCDEHARKKLGPSLRTTSELGG